MVFSRLSLFASPSAQVGLLPPYHNHLVKTLVDDQAPCLSGCMYLPPHILDLVHGLALGVALEHLLWNSIHVRRKRFLPVLPFLPHGWFGINEFATPKGLLLSLELNMERKGT